MTGSTELERYETIRQRLAAGERILIDGATGTEVERRGVPQLENAWNGGGALSHPDIVRDIHLDYIREGAEIVISNTFATTRHALEDAGAGDLFDDYNRRGVELAVEARDGSGRPDVLVAGGVSYWSWTERHPPLDQLRNDAEQQMAVMKAAGAELLMLEMMVEIDRMTVLLDAARKTGLPVWAGLSCKPDASGTPRLFRGDLLSDAIIAAAEGGATLINIMHTEVEHVDACLDVVEDLWRGPVGVYAHSGAYDNGKWFFNDVISPEDYADAARRWIARGVQVIGGCCGVRAAHVAALKEIL